MNIFHKDLVSRWNSLSSVEQMANIGAEVGRAIIWRKKDKKYSLMAFYRALELLDFTMNDPKNRESLREITRLRELIVDYFAGDNIYNSSDEQWERYFYPFNLAVRRGR
ncbi:hypothetical protein HYW87_02530 [Candidatus Roizmanbacteria bacterium]|nr:hypothetical protein [Candidatus Roizmanbacteria bacterium]